MVWDVHGGDPTRAHSLTPKGRCLFVASRECRDGDVRSPPVHRAGPSPHHQRAPGQPVSCLWGRLHYSPGSWLRLEGCGFKAISHSGGPLPLCPFSVLPPIWAVPVDPEQPMSCQLQGLEGTESQENLARTRRVKFLDEEGGAEEAQREASCSQEQPSCSRASSSLSLESPDKPNMLALRACDSVRLLRKRAKKIREAQEQPKEMAAARSCGETSRPKQSTRNRSVLLPPIREENESPTEKMAAETSRGEPSLPEEPPVVRSEFLPAIKEGTGSPRGQSPKTKDPPRRKGTHYPC